MFLKKEAIAQLGNVFDIACAKGFAPGTPSAARLPNVKPEA